MSEDKTMLELQLEQLKEDLKEDTRKALKDERKWVYHLTGLGLGATIAVAGVCIYTPALVQALKGDSGAIITVVCGFGIFLMGFATMWSYRRAIKPKNGLSTSRSQ